MMKQTISQTPKILTMLGILCAMVFWDYYCDYRGEETVSLSQEINEKTEINEPEIVPEYTYLENGVASHYGYGWDGRTTASEEILDCNAFQAAHLTLDFGTVVRVSLSENPEKYVDVKIVDRGPHVEGRVIDLTPAAFQKLAPLSRGVVQVDLAVQELSSPDEE